MKYGLDFGTSNTSLSVNLDDVNMLVPLESFTDNPEVMPSLWLYDYTEDYWAFGTKALTRYNESGGDGRFIQALKTHLGDRELKGTWIQEKFVTFDQMIKLYLKNVKFIADRYVGEDVKKVRIGKPVKFSLIGSDELAIQRIENSAREIGFEEIKFMYEPLAATYSIKGEIEKPTLVFALDVGGGTTDISIVRLFPMGTNLEDDILASEGINIAGNDFTSAIMKNRLLKYFGKGTKYRNFSGREEDFPPYLLQALTKWYVSFRLIHDRNFMEHLRITKNNCSEPEKVRALEQLIHEHLGFDIFQAVEKAKKELSFADEAIIEFHDGHIRIDETITRKEFERYIYDEVERINRLIDSSLNKINLSRYDVNRVLLVGGSSKIPLFRKKMEDMFPNSLITDKNQLTSVAYGLGCATEN